MPLARISRLTDSPTGGEVVSVALDLTEGSPLALGEPVVSGSRATFAEVLPGVDLALSVNEDGTGFGPTLVLKTVAALSDPRLEQIEFDVSVSGGLRVVPVAGGFEVTDQEGVVWYTSPAPVMWDSSGSTVEDLAGDRVSARGVGGDVGEAVDRVASPLPGDVVAPIGLELEPAGDGATRLMLTPDAGMLADPEVSLPVHLDPDVEITAPQSRTTVQSAWPNSTSGWAFAGDAGVGLCDPNAPYENGACATTFGARNFYQYEGIPMPDGVTAADVSGSTFSLFGTHSYGCSNGATEVVLTAPIHAGTSWSTQPSWGSVLARSTDSYRPECGGQRFTEHNVLAGARLIADRNGHQLTFGVRGDESSMAGWKRFSHAQLSIVWNRAPNPPSGMAITSAGVHRAECITGQGRPVIRDLTPRLSMVLGDPDADQVTAHYELWNPATGLMVWDAHPAGAQRSGSVHSVDVPSGKLALNGTYSWHMAAHDTLGRSGRAGFCEFTVDQVSPNIPTIESKNGVYPKDTLINVTGTAPAGEFILGRNTSVDVNRWYYAFDTDVLTGPYAASPTNGSLTIPFPAGKPGPHVMFARSVDKAGNVSPVQMYRFGTSFPTASGLWHLDDAAGTVAADSALVELPDPSFPGDEWAAQSRSNPLTVAGSTIWGSGRGGTTGLYFDDPADQAYSVGPVLRTDRSFTVSAFVKLTDVQDVVRTAVSQDGFVSGAFKLGQLPSRFCASGITGCWGFWMPSADRTGAPVVAVSDTPPVPGQWTHLTGVHDAESGEIRLYICGTDTVWSPVLTDDADFLTPWPSSGSLRIGQGMATSRLQEPFAGAVDDVRVYATALSEERIRQVCGGQQVS